MFSSRCFRQRCTTSRTPLSDNKKRNQQKKRERFQAWRRKTQEYLRPTFNDIPKSSLTPEQVALVEYFENYPIVQKREEYNKNNTPYAIINIRQRDFVNGTLRVKVPGVYVLQENISFEPNKDNDFFPTAAQIQSGEYPMGMTGPYHLGFFAAMTIETNNVIIDLNGKSIQQTPLHNLQQRFYANIELASAPFIPTQGPGNFGDSIVKPNNVLIMNGGLGLSSHHGIHGNDMSKVILKNLVIQHMEVAAIALNGAEQSILDNITITGTATNIPIVSTYSQGRFIRKFLNNLKSRLPTAAVSIEGASKSLDSIISELNTELDATRDSILNDNIIPANIFGNSSKLYDGNVYGIVLNVRGVVVNDFFKTRPAEALGNKFIYLQRITINNTTSLPVEILAVNSTPEDGGAYGGKRQVGPVGDIFTITLATESDDTYKGNTLANAQIILAKHNDPKNGTTNIEAPIVNWVESDSLLTDTFNNNDYYYVGGGDSMGHAMKGNIGLFVSAAQYILMKNIVVNSVTSKGDKVGNSPLIADASQNKQGAMSTGILITGSNFISMNSVAVKNINSKNGDANGVLVLSSSNITQSNLNITNVTTDSDTSTATNYKEE